MQTQNMTENMTENVPEKNVKSPENNILKTRFGETAYNPEKLINFPNGILGMPGQTNFAVAEMPIEKLNKFQVLQSMVEDDISFAVLPLDIINEDSIDKEDLEEVRAILEFGQNDMLVLLIAAVQRSTEGNKLTVNMRAPLFIDVEKNAGYQIVLANSKYKVQHVLS